ncbi:MAG: DUF2807 domain-containing protein [Bacteroidales bacterium]|nr:DUF2807 domain-containing protein [Bacteroidales bacterium]
MRKKLFILSTLVLFALCSCNKVAGDPISKDFNIEGSYTELQVENGFEVTVSNVATTITITAGENIMPKVLVEKVGNKLRIHLKPMTSNYGSEMKVILPYNADLTNVNLSGGSEFHSEYGLDGKKIEVDLSGGSEFYCGLRAAKVDVDMSGGSKLFGDIDADEIDMELSGASEIKGAVSATELDVELSGGSDATLEGEVNKLEVNLSGASNITEKVVGSRYALVCDQCQGDLSGASEVYIHCDGSIKVSLSGGSELHYTGNAATTGCDCSGGSEISHDVL